MAADRTPPVFLPDEHTITVPDSIRKTVQAIWDAEWWRLGVAPEIGGTAVARSVTWAALEMIICANPALFFFYAGPPMADILYAIGNEKQRALANAAIEQRWGATMVLTEPDAGSDVGAGRTKAIEQPDGSWHIEGVKRFISGGDLGDTVENILHLVLARPRGRRARAPRASACSSCRSTCSIGIASKSPGAMGFSRPGSSTRWATRPPPPAS